MSTAVKPSPVDTVYEALTGLVDNMHLLAGQFEQARARGQFESLSAGNASTVSSIITRLRVDAGRFTGIMQYANLTGPNMRADVMRDHDDTFTYYLWAKDIHAMLPPAPKTN